MLAPETRYTWSGDISIAYQVFGDGPRDLVIVPGWLSNLDLFWEEPNFVRFFEGLASFCRVILFDKRGTGLSDRSCGVSTLEERMDDVRAVMDAVGSEKASLFGYSEGGPMCILFATTHPDRTDSLIVAGSYACSQICDEYPHGKDPEQTRTFLDLMRDEWGGPIFLDVIAPSMAADPRFRQWWSKFVRGSASLSTAADLTLFGSEIDVRPLLPSVQVPTLILHAKDDLVRHIDEGRFLARSIAGAHLVELETTDHLPSVGCPEQILAEIQRTMTGQHQSHDVDRVVSTVLFTDIVDSTRLAAELGNTRWRDLLDVHNTAVRRELQVYRGREVKSTGDGIHAVFDGPARAIQCGKAIQQAMQAIGLSVRVGMHTGECEIRRDEIEGVAIHIAARVSAIAKQGEVLVSQTVRDLVAGSGFEFEDRGLHRLRGVPEEWRILAVA